MGKRFTLDLPAAVRAFYREAAARRRREPRRCVVCGQAVVATPRRQYCSAACSQRAYRARRLPPAAPLSPARVPPVERAPSLGRGSRVALRRSLPDVPIEAEGTIVDLQDDRACVRFDGRGDPRRVLLAWLQPAPRP